MSKEQELHDKLLEKTREGKLKWEMDDVTQYSIKVGDFRVFVNLRSLVMGVYKGEDFLTSLPGLSTGELFKAAEASCEFRNQALAAAIKALEEL